METFSVYMIDVYIFSQAYCYIVSGGCFSIALRFAGSANQSAYDLLVSYLYIAISI